MAAEIMYVNDDDVDDFVLGKLRYAVRFADGKAGFVCSGTEPARRGSQMGANARMGCGSTSSEAKSDGRFCQSTKRREGDLDAWLRCNNEAECRVAISLQSRIP